MPSFAPLVDFFYHSTVL